MIAVGLDGKARYYEELPVDYVRESTFGTTECYFIVTLEYGPDHDQVDPFDVTVGRISQTETQRSEEGRYLHPVVRRFHRGTLVATHHVTENLENDWTGPLHREPLEAFFTRQLNTADVAA
jgi:hypothetical protein